MKGFVMPCQGMWAFLNVLRLRFTQYGLVGVFFAALLAALSRNAFFAEVCLVASSYLLVLGRSDQLVISWPKGRTAQVEPHRLQSAFCMHSCWVLYAFVAWGDPDWVFVLARLGVVFTSLAMLVLCWRDGFGRPFTFLWVSVMFVGVVLCLYHFGVSEMPFLESLFGGALWLAFFYTMVGLGGQIIKLRRYTALVKRGDTKVRFHVSYLETGGMFVVLLCLLVYGWCKVLPEMGFSEAREVFLMASVQGTLVGTIILHMFVFDRTIEKKG